MNSNYIMESMWHSSELKDKAKLIQSQTKTLLMFELIPEFVPSKYQMEIEANFGIKNIEMIGGGKFGSVFTAIQNRSNEMVTFKAISATNTILMSMLRFCKTAKNEIRILQTLKHDNIVKYYDHAKLLHPHYMIPVRVIIKMEHLDTTLEQAISNKLFTEKQCLQVFKQVGAALEYLHCDQRIAHHDLKPNNIMMKKANNFEECIFKVIDFGLAKVYSTEMEETLDVLWRGAPLYMAPEKYKLPSNPYNPFLADSYAFGYCLIVSIIGTEKFKVLWMNYYGKISETFVHKCVRNEPIASALKSLISLNPEKRLFVRDALKIIF